MRQIGKYIVEDSPIGSGGMGRVLRGLDPEGRVVAIKEVHEEFARDPEFRYRVESELRFLRRLNANLPDTNALVHVHENFEAEGKIYIVMDLVEGANVEQYVAQNGPMPFARAGAVMEKILGTMQSVHEQGVIHRDIKPGNIMIRPDHSICILDFGVARNTDTGSAGHTVMGTVIGTDGYMSPEQANGLSVDHRSDIYSLACVFFFLITGHHAYSNNGSNVNMMIDIVNKPFPRIDQYVKGLPDTVQAILDKASDKNMMRRYQSCREFEADLRRVVYGGTMVDPGMSNGEITVSIGRENCDIIAGFNNFKVSRHHADVRYMVSTSGHFFVYTDCSSNGSVVNGTILKKGMSYNIPLDSIPEIFLANEADARVNWEEVLRAFQSRMPKEVVGNKKGSKKEVGGKVGNKTTPGVVSKILNIFRFGKNPGIKNTKV